MSGKTYLAVAGTAAAMFFSLEQHGLQSSVLNAFSMALRLSGLTLAYTFCILPYALALCEDMEHHYVRYQVIRGNLKKYVFSKVAVIYLSSVAALLLGGCLFVLICRSQVPWIKEGYTDMELMRNTAYGQFFSGKHYGIYCVIQMLHTSLLAGMLSVSAAFLSLYISNKVMVIALPVCAYQIWVEFAPDEYASVYVFRTTVKLFAHDWQCFFYALFFSLLFTILCGIGILRKLKKCM